MQDIIKLRKKLLNFSFLFFILLVIINIISFILLKKLDLLLIVISFISIFLSLFPYFRDFSIENFKLTFFMQGLGLIILSLTLYLQNPIFIFLVIFSCMYIVLISMFKDSHKYSIPIIFITLLVFLFSFYVGDLLSINSAKEFLKVSFLSSAYLYFVLISLALLILAFLFSSEIRNFIIDFYKSQVMSIVHSKIEEINKIAQERAKEAEEKHRESVLIKEKQQKIFEINANLAKKVKNIKAQLQYISSELKEMLYATGVVILMDKSGLISADYYIDVPLPVVEILKVSPKSNEIIRKFIFKSLRNKDIVYINKRKEIFQQGFSREECLSFLQEISKLTFEVYEVLMVPIINSFGDSMGVFVIFNNKYDGFTDVDKRLAELLGVQAGILIHNSMLIKKLEDTFYETINAFSSAIEAKDKYTPVLHTYRVGELAYKVALEMGLSEEEAEKIKIAGILHDVGKLAIPDSILAKQGPLTEEEREIIKTHSEEGSKILSKISFFREKNIHIYVLYHHERVDGRGYPKGLRGREIPLASNIISVADTYDAISTPRPYNKQYASEQKAIEIIKSERGRQFFEEVVDAFFRVLEKEKMKKRTNI